MLKVLGTIEIISFELAYSSNNICKPVFRLKRCIPEFSNLILNIVFSIMSYNEKACRRSACPKDLARDSPAIEVTKRNVSKTKPVFQAKR